MIALPQQRTARLAVLAIAAIGATIVVAFLLWWLLIRPRAAQVAKAEARVESAVAKGVAGAARDTVKIVVEHDRQVAAIDATTERNDRAIHSAAGADAPAPAVAGALRAALCLRDAYRDNPGCAAVSRSGDGVGAAAVDGGRGAAGE